MSGVEAARAIGSDCHIVFVTAYGEFAIEAFEQGAVDYVLKPAEIARLEVTVGRLKQRLQAPPPDLGRATGPALAQAGHGSRRGSGASRTCNGYRPRSVSSCG